MAAYGVYAENVADGDGDDGCCALRVGELLRRHAQSVVVRLGYDEEWGGESEQRFGQQEERKKHQCGDVVLALQHTAHSLSELAAMQTHRRLRLGVAVWSAGQEDGVPEPQKQFHACHHVEHKAPRVAYVACHYFHIAAHHRHYSAAEEEGHSQKNAGFLTMECCCVVVLRC